jgi:hypothetical protein
VKKILKLVCPLALCSMALLAQTQKSFRVIRGTDTSPALHVPAANASPTLKVIYSNLGKVKTNLYADNYGYAISGPESNTGEMQFVGMPFTPTSDSHVLQVRVAVEYGGSGANQVYLSLYTDSGGVPGELIAGPVTVKNLPSFLTCCTLAIADFPSVAVPAGMQYWVVANTPLSGTGSDFYGGWDFVPLVIPQAADDGSGWYAIGGFTEEAAGEVLGTIP